MKVASIAKGTFISSHDTLQDAQKERKRLLAVMPKVSQYGTFELFCEPYEGIWAVFMYKNLTKGTLCGKEKILKLLNSSLSSVLPCSQAFLSSRSALPLLLQV